MRNFGKSNMADLPFTENGHLMLESLTDPCLLSTKISSKVSDFPKQTVVGQ